MGKCLPVCAVSGVPMLPLPLPAPRPRGSRREACVGFWCPSEEVVACKLGPQWYLSLAAHGVPAAWPTLEGVVRNMLLPPQVCWPAALPAHAKPGAYTAHAASAYCILFSAAFLTLFCALPARNPHWPAPRLPTLHSHHARLASQAPPHWWAPQRLQEEAEV